MREELPEPQERREIFFARRYQSYMVKTVCAPLDVMSGGKTEIGKAL